MNVPESWVYHFRGSIEAWRTRACGLGLVDPIVCRSVHEAMQGGNFPGSKHVER